MPHTVLPPASPGLPPAGVSDTPPRDKFRNKYPSKKGRWTDDERAIIAKAAIDVVEMGPLEFNQAVKSLAITTERDPQTIKAKIKEARQKLQMRAVDYVDLHLKAAQKAADLGDAKPAQWALERIVEGEQRVVEREKAGIGQPALNIGIAIGGMGKLSATVVPVTAADLPVMDATIALIDDTP